MEIDVLKWVDATFHSQSWLNYIMKYVTYLGEFGAVPIAVALILLIFKRTCPAGFAAAIALVANVLIVNVILKLSVNRARPWTEYEEFKAFYTQFGIRTPTDSSFPSGHTAACFCVAMALVLRYKVKGLPALAVALLVAISRIYLCLHYPTDVLGGLLIGSACGVGGHFLGLWLYPKVAKFVEERILKRSAETVEGGCEDGAEESFEEPASEDSAEIKTEE